MTDSKNLCNFELLLKKNNDKTPSSLYNNTIVNNPTIKPQEVLESVYSQIKSIQRADGKNIKSVGKNLNLVKSDFLTVSKLPMYDQVPKQLNTFETQCFSDTQLINITEDAEALIDTHKGMSEEFDTAFTHTKYVKNIGASFTHDKTERDNNRLFETQEFDTTFTQTNVDDTVSFSIDRLERDRKENDANNLINKIDQTQPSNGKELGLFELESVNTLKDICGNVLVGNKSLAPNIMDKLSVDNYGEEVPTKDNKLASSSNKTKETIHIGLENIPIDKKTEDKTIDNKTEVTNHTMISNHSIATDIEEVKDDRSPSPVLKLKSATKLKSHLVVPLEYFERFEKLAVPLIDSNNHIDTCKYLINSQILKGELCLNTGTDVIFNECGQLSPIIKKRSEISQNKELSNIVIDSNNEDSREHCSDNEKSNENKQGNDESMANNALTLISKTDTKRSDHLKDEILFSSDEENDFIYKEFHDMPLTAALDTSFGDSSDVFEETMYVGFQTASSKSIQICADSYQKAQFILGEREDNHTDFSLTELVEVCEKKNIYNDLKIQAKDNSKFKDIEASSVINQNNDKTQIKMNESYVDRDEEMIDISKIEVTAVTHYDSILKKPPKKQNFLGFKTASNKNIDLSAKALDHGKTVFNDIDFDEKIDLMDQDDLENSNEEPKVEDNITNYTEIRPETDIDGKINDDLIIQEFENIEMSLKEKETCFNTDNKTTGFKTANSKNIDISNAAKAKINDVFHDIDLREINENSEEFFPKNKQETEILPRALLSENTGRIIGFKTASNRNINISDEALAKTKNVFQEIDTEIKTLCSFEFKNSKIEVLDHSNHQSTSKSTFVDDKQSIMEAEESDQDYSKDLEKAKMSNVFEGFKTASNKQVIVSEQALLKSMKIFQELGGNCQNEEVTKSKIKNDSSFSGFQTANNKAIAVSEESIAKSKTLFEDLGSDLNKKSIRDEHINTNNTYKGFQTASNKSVSVSVNALELTKKKFQNIDDNELVIKANTDSETMFKEFESNKEVPVAKNAVEASMKLFDEFNADKPTCSFVGFKTASNKNVKVSEVALAKCRKIFDDLDDLPENNFKVNETETFKTANNEKVEVTKEALQQTKNLFNDIKMPEITEQMAFTGFHTASKKKVEVSEEGLEKTNAMFRDFDESELKEPLFRGFQTAGKKKVEVSEEAIRKTKAMFKDIIELEPKEPTFKGFQTASKKKVEVSKEAMALSKQIFEDIDTNSNNVLDKQLNVDNHGEKMSKEKFSFQTANNQCVDVSKDALSKSRRLLEDLCDTDNKLLKNDLNKISKEETLKLDNTVNLDNLINTQVLNNFQENLCTEDFKETPRKSKRSGSPILSCPRAKKRKKFETPYKVEKDKKVEDVIEVDKKNTCTVKVKFTENYKKNKMYGLKDLTKFFNNKRHIDPYITNFNLENILNFDFAAHRNELTHTQISVNEIKYIFLSGVNKNLVPEGWLDNHLKLILWKLLSYESKLAGLSYLCTVQSVIDQLKYRYDKELYDAERPALRKIFERDEVSTKTLVLCVAGIHKDVNISVTNSKGVELLLTDGWYFIMGTTDKMLSELVSKGRIIIGSKIVTSGAELLNCGQGIAPWEDTSAVRLKLFGNSTRPAPWDAKLGFARAAILNHLSSVKVDGGKVNRLRVFVTRVYPLLYVEKFEDGSAVTRSERLEHLHQMKCEAERELMMERIYEEVQKEFSDQESQDSEVMESGKRKYYDSGSQIAKIMKHSKDPMEFRAQLTSSQVQLLQEHSCKYREKLIQAIQKRVQDQINSRNVVTLARGRIAAVNDDTIEITKGMLSVWKPNDGVMELFREGSWVEIMNVVPTAIRYSEIQITAGRQSVFKPVKCKNEVLPHLRSLRRTCYKISDVTQNPSMNTEHNEIDTVGIVILIEPSNQEFESSKNFQNVYLADADKNIISLNFWGGIKKFGFENILDTCQIVACTNLQKRAGNTRKNIPQFRVTEFSHFTKTPKNMQAREMVDDLNKKVSDLDRRKFCDDCIAIKNNYTAIKCLNNSENESPYRFHGIDYSLVRNKMFIDTPVGAQPHKNEDVNFNLTGLDFESSFQQDAEELSPNTLLRKKKVNERIDKLKRYGEPPPLCPINIINKSVNAKNSFKSPLVSINSSVATLNNVTRNSASITNKLPEESPKTTLREFDRERSPVISTKRAYVRSVPVKLNFVNETENNLVDHFAEDFDGSPPLSLD